ncbi:hypothetical protein Dimus_018624 [Dionaea muscipula]
MMKGFQSALFVCQQCSKHATKLADLRTKIESMRLDEADQKKQLSKLDEENAQLKQELSEKEEENKQLVKEMTDQVMNVVLEARGSLMKKYRDGLASGWDVAGKIKLMEDLLSSARIEAVDQNPEDTLDDLDTSHLSPLSKE